MRTFITTGNPIKSFALLIFVLSACWFYGAGCRKSLSQLETPIPQSDAHFDTVLIRNVSGLLANRTVNVYVEDTLYQATFKQGNNRFSRLNPVSVFFNQQKGDIHLKLAVIPTGRTSPRTADQADVRLVINLPRPQPGQNLQVVVYDSVAGIPAFKVLAPPKHNGAKLGFGSFRLRVANYASDASVFALTPYRVSLFYENNQPVSSLSSIDYASVSNYQEFDYDTYQFKPVIDELGEVAGNGFWTPSYFFAPGGSYTLLVSRVFGYSFTELLKDDLPDNADSAAIGRAQFINADPFRQEAVFQVTDGTHIYRDTCLFGEAKGPYSLKTGPASYTITSLAGNLLSQGQTLITPLINACSYLLPLLPDKPRYLSVAQRISNADYTYVNCDGDPLFKQWEQAHLNFLNLCPDVSSCSFFLSDPNGFEAIPSGTGGIAYSQFKLNALPSLTVGSGGTSGQALACGFAFNNYPTGISARIFPGEGSTQAGREINYLRTRGGNAPINGHPGDYTAVLVGSTSATTLVQRPRIIIIKNNHNHYAN